MNCEIICVGTELLLGETLNTNSAYIAGRLSQAGVNVYKHTVVGDNPERLKSVVEYALTANDAVVLTGGLGPTCDDLTKETVAAYFDKTMVLDERALTDIKEYFKSAGKQMTENNEKQALVPEGAQVLYNRNGTAPGIIIEACGKLAVLLPGPPREMKELFDNEVMPYLCKKSGKTMVSTNIHLFGIGEAAAESKLKQLMNSLSNPTLAPYAKDGEVLLRVTAAAESSSQAEKMIQPIVEQVRTIIGDEYIYGINVENLQTALVKVLSSKGLKIASAESCTGGLVSKRITDVSGASEVFDCGVCTYANSVKEQLIGVSHETLVKYGAVSAQTAQEMAMGVRKLANADIGISTTGLAGPTGGTAEKPVGTVYIGISTKSKTVSKKLFLGHKNGSERDLIRYLASSHVIYEALRCAQSL